MSGMPVEVWRGSAPAWECDHLGHLNTRFYMARVELALAGFLAMVGLSRTAIAIEAQHIRFHREVRAGAALHATAQLVRSATPAWDVLIALHHSGDDALAATFRLSIAGDSLFGAAVPVGLVTALPSAAAERGMAMANLRLPQGGLQRADALGLQRTGLSIVTDEQCDGDGRWRLSAAMGLVADCVPHLHHQDWHQVLARSLPEVPGRIGGALVEFGFRYRRWPASGDRVEVRSARTDCTERVFRTVHWLLDPGSGAAWAAVMTVGVALDLDARKLIPLTAEAQAAYSASAVSTIIDG